MSDQWVPKHLRPTAWWIWNKKFKCRVPYLKSLSIDKLKQFGMPDSGDPMVNRQMANEMVDRLLTINVMTEYFMNGVTVAVVDPKDTGIIYEYISNHLNFWLKQLEGSWNVRGAPIADLIKLDEFANAVYKHAKYQFTQEIVDSVLHRKLSSHMRVTRRLMPSPSQLARPAEGQGEVKKKDKYPERQSLAEQLETHRKILEGGGNPRWK